MVGWVAFVLTLVVAVWLRAAQLGAKPFWVDEAESSINALTILEHGYPTDHYLGLPLYENTLTEPWPEHPEYEFRDSSYSRGMAVYHGWLPLYSIAASFAAAGIGPSAERDGLIAQRTPEYNRRLTIVARIPSILFALLFLILAFRTGHALGGKEAAWAALVLAGFYKHAIPFQSLARYYSASLALGTACGLLLWRAARTGKWADSLGAGLALALLFHTHAVTFVALCGVALLLTPRLLRHGWLKTAALGLTVASAVVPFVVWTGLFSKTPFIPLAFPLLSLPGDLLDSFHPARRTTLLVLLSVVLPPTVRLFRSRLPADWSSPFLELKDACAFTTAWLVCAYLAATLLFPAASYWIDRAYLCLLPPALLSVALLVTASVRLRRRVPALPGAAALALAALVLTNGVAVRPPGTLAPDRHDRALLQLVDALRSWPMAHGLRLYATPNHHLVLSLYTGRPIQSIAPVRRSFLDSYPGRLLLLQCTSPYVGFGPAEISRMALAQGVSLPEAEAHEWATRLLTRAVREDLSARVAEIIPPLEDLPSWAEGVAAAARRDTTAQVPESQAIVYAPAMMRGVALGSWADWWPVFFYRFVNPEQRMGSHLNFADRARGARAELLPSSWVIYDCPPRTGSER